MSRKFEFSESERGQLEELHALSFDSKGREVLIGLSFEETAWYVTQTQPSWVAIVPIACGMSICTTSTKRRAGA